MKNRIIVCLHLVLLISFLTIGESLAQSKINVVFKPIQFYANDSTKYYLVDKLPALICNGINTNSSLHYITLRDSASNRNYLYSDIDFKTIISDKRLTDRYRAVFKHNRIDFFLEGSISISDQQFSLVINGTDFNQQIATYQSGLRPISELADVIDKACANLNFQIFSVVNQKKITNATLVNFNINYLPSPKKTQQEYDLGDSFPVKYLLSNLKSGDRYLIEPGVKSDKIFDADTAKIFITGKVLLSDNGISTVEPIIYFNKKDSINLQPVKANIQQKDSLLLILNDNIQTTLDVLFNKGGLKTVKDFLRVKKHSQQEYEKVINDAYSADQFILAYYYTEQLGINYKNVKNNSTLFKGKIFYSENKFDDAIASLNKYLEIDSKNLEARYYLGLSYLKIGRYDLSRKLLESIDPATKQFNDLYYQTGICFYNLGAAKTALGYFINQEQRNKKINIYTSYYKSLCYKALDDWDEGLVSLKDLYKTDTLNIIVVKNYLGDYYADFAIYEFSKNRFRSAMEKFALSYDLTGKSSSLGGQLQSAIFLNSANSTIDGIIEKGISSQSFKTDLIYLDVSKYYENAFDVKKDTSLMYKAISYRKLDYQLNSPSITQHYRNLGIEYLKINRIDSARYFFKLVLKNEDNLSNYLNLSELEIISFNFKEALYILNTMDQKYRLTTNQYVGKGESSSLLLMYFFKAQIQLLKNKIPEAEVKGMEEILKTYKDLKEPLLSDWNFKTYYIWLTNTPKVENEIRGKMIKLMCPLIQISEDKTLSCATDRRN